MTDSNAAALRAIRRACSRGADPEPCRPSRSCLINHERRGLDPDRPTCARAGQACRRDPRAKPCRLPVVPALVPRRRAQGASCRRSSAASPRRGPARIGLRSARRRRRAAWVAIWLALGKFPWSPLRQLRGTGWMLSVLRADPRSFRAFMQTGANSARLHPADPHWYLETMGVDPAVQRRASAAGCSSRCWRWPIATRSPAISKPQIRATPTITPATASSSRTRPFRWCRTARLISPCGAGPVAVATPGPS